MTMFAIGTRARRLSAGDAPVRLNIRQSAGIAKTLKERGGTVMPTTNKMTMCNGANSSFMFMLPYALV